MPCVCYRETDCDGLDPEWTFSERNAALELSMVLNCYKAIELYTVAFAILFYCIVYSCISLGIYIISLDN